MTKGKDFKIMKKKISLLTAGVLITSLLAGCSSGGTYSKYVKLGQYKGLALDKVKSEVTDETIEEEIEAILEDNAKRTEITDRAAKEGDEVNVNFTGTIDGKEFEDGSADDFELVIGEGYMLDEFEEGIIGMEVSETKDVEVTFTEDYDEDLAGQKAVFKITLNSIAEVTEQEYNDAFVAEISEFSTTAEYEADLKEQLLAEQEENNLYAAGEEAVQKVIENSTFDGYPQELYDECKAEYDESNAQLAEMFGMDVAELEMSEEETQQAVMEMVNSKMVIVTIAEAEKLEVTDEEYEAYVQGSYEEYGYESIGEFETDYSKESITEQLLTNKVMDLLVENATITEISEDEYLEYEDEDDDELELTDDDFDDEYLDENNTGDSNEPSDDAADDNDTDNTDSSVDGDDTDDGIISETVNLNDEDE